MKIFVKNVKFLNNSFSFFSGNPSPLFVMNPPHP